MGKRYAMRLDPEGWTVVDGLTDRAALVGSRKQQGLDFDEAEALTERLNREAQRALAGPRPATAARGGR